jgi:L1 cell adhesion molecule like protein
MIDIMSHLQQYVPTYSVTSELTDPDSNETIPGVADYFHYILFGRDQLTVERATGSKNKRINECRGLERLEGLRPVIEDWHSKVCLLKVIEKLTMECYVLKNIYRPYEKHFINIFRSR